MKKFLYHVVFLLGYALGAYVAMLVYTVGGLVVLVLLNTVLPIEISVALALIATPYIGSFFVKTVFQLNSDWEQIQ